MYTITHIPLSVQTKELYNAMEINQSLSTHKITKQYQTTAHFHLNLTKQYTYVGAQDPLYDTAFCEHISALFTQQQHKSSQLPHRIPHMIPEEFQIFIAAASFTISHTAVLVLSLN
jgi:ACT domain-containing protein